MAIPESPAAEDKLWYDDGVPYVDELGRSTTAERPAVSPSRFVKAASVLLEIDLALLAGRSRNREVSRARRLVVLLGVERWGLSGRELAPVLGRTTDVVSWIVGRAVGERMAERRFRQAMEELDRRMAERLMGARGLR